MHNHVTTAMFGWQNNAWNRQYTNLLHFDLYFKFQHLRISTLLFEHVFVFQHAPTQPKTFITLLVFLYLPQRHLSVDQN